MRHDVQKVVLDEATITEGKPPLQLCWPGGKSGASATPHNSGSGAADDAKRA